MLKHENINSPLSQQVILYGEYDFSSEIRPQKMVKKVSDEKKFENRERISVNSQKTINLEDQTLSNFIKNSNLEAKEKSV